MTIYGCWISPCQNTLLYLVKPPQKLLLPAVCDAVCVLGVHGSQAGLRWAIPFALAAQGASFQLIGSPIVSKISLGRASWRGTTTRRPFRCNHVRDHDAASGTSAGTGSEAGYGQAREAESAESGSSPLVEYFVRWVHPSSVRFLHNCTAISAQTGS